MVTITDKGIKPFISTANAGGFFYIDLPEPDELCGYHIRLKHQPNTNSQLVMYAYNDESLTSSSNMFLFRGNATSYYSTTDTGFTFSGSQFIHLTPSLSASNTLLAVTDIWIYSANTDGNQYPSLRFHSAYNNTSYTVRSEGNAVLETPSGGTSSDRPKRLRFNRTTQTAITEVNGWLMGR